MIIYDTVRKRRTDIMINIVVPHYKQSNIFPVSLENHQQIYGYTCVYSISVSGLVFAAFPVCHRCTQVLEKCIIRNKTVQYRGRVRL